MAKGLNRPISGWRAPGDARVRPILWLLLLAGLLSLGLAQSAPAACRVGLIDTNTTWRKADSPCIVDQSVLVSEGVTLTIEPGVTVKVNTGLAIRIDGTLIARGTATDPIIVSSNNPVTNNGGGGISISGATSTLSHNTITGNNSVFGGGISIYGGTSTTISGNTITSNSSDSGGGISISIYSDGTSIISDNTITGNISSSGGGGISISGGTSTISDNTITGNSGSFVAGISISGGTPTITSNRIQGNLGSRGSAIAVFGSGTISGNTIVDNTAPGTGTDSSTLSIIGTPTINRNNIYGNTGTYAMVNDNFQGTPNPNLDARNNWWGTTDEGEIHRLIYDFFDNGMLGIVDHHPYLTERDPEEAAYAYLAEVMNRYQATDIPRLLESYTATPTFTSQRNVAHLYDSALALLAFLERGTPDDLSRARTIAEALLSLQQNDPIGDGRLRDAYAADSLLDGAGRARPQLTSSHTGNLAWAILALTRYYQAQGGERYREAAVRLGEWIGNAFDSRGAGGFTGGVDDNLQPLRWKSTEHNLDLYAAFLRLYQATQERRWLGWAAHAKGFVEAMWDEGEGHFWTGTLEDGVEINPEPVPLDVQAWAVLALGGRFAGGLSWTRQNLWLEPCECGRFKGYRFSTAGGGCWFEGSAHMALALKLSGEPGGSDDLLRSLQEVQASAPNGDGSGIMAACSDGVETGYGWSYFNALHVGATAWYLLAKQGVNPLEAPAVGPSVSGTVQDSKKLPVPGVRVEARQADGTLVGVGRTDEQGNYRLELPAGKYILTPGKEAHLFSPASRKVTVKARDLGKLNFTVRLLTLSGTVKGKTGRPLAGVTILLRQGETVVDRQVTDARGRYNFSLCNPGTYTVEPSLEGSQFVPPSAEVTLTNGNRGRINFREVP